MQLRLRLPSPPTSWVWLLSLFTVAGFIEAAFWGQLSAFTPLYLPRLGIAENDVAFYTGLTVAISSAIGLPFLPLWGALADKYARQPVIVRSFVAHVLAGVLALLAHNIWVFIIARAIQSFSLGNSGLMMSTLTERAPAQRVGFAFSVMNTAPTVGAFVGPLLGGGVVDRWGFQTLLAINVLLMLVVVIGMSLGYRDTYHGTNRGSVLSMAFGSVGVVWRSPRLRALFPALFIVFAGWMLAFTYVPLAIKELYHGDSPGTVVGVILGAGGLLSVFLGPALGAIADRKGMWRTLIASLVVEVILWPLPALTRDLVSFGVAWALLNGVASGAFALSFTVLSASVEPSARGRVMSFAYLPVNAGYLAGPALGAIITRTSVFAVFPASAAITLLGIGAVLLAQRQAIVRAPIAVEQRR